MSNKRINNLSELARQALDQYKADMAAGSEPVYPQWARDMHDMLGAHEQLVASLKELTVGLRYLGMKETAEPLKRAAAALTAAGAA